MTTAAGIVDRPSGRTVDETVERIEALLRTKGITLFALIDHSGEAAKVGLKMPPTKLLIFGKPEAGTSLMLASPRSAIDLPLKILVWEDAGGRSGSAPTAPLIFASGTASRWSIFRRWPRSKR